MEAIRYEDVSFSYGTNENKVLENVTFSVNEGEFVVFCGETGCGKTTMLSLIKQEIAPFGIKTGKMYCLGSKLDETVDTSTSIGYVMQNPQSQIVTDFVWSELAFGLENMGVDKDEINRRVGEIANYFNISSWFRKSTNKLSGGQLQILNLAAVMVMNPSILLFDEPTSQLDPIAATEFIEMIRKVNRDFGTTIILIEHNLESIFDIADKIGVLSNHKLILFGDKYTISRQLYEMREKERIYASLPPAVKMYFELATDRDDIMPISVREARDYLGKNFTDQGKVSTNVRNTVLKDKAISLRNVSFKYCKTDEMVIRECSLDVFRGEIFACVGENGSGKSTLTKLISGLCKPYCGHVKLYGKSVGKYKNNELYRNMISVLPQDPSILFMEPTVREDYVEMCKACRINKDEWEKKIKEVSSKLNLEKIMDKHPYDLSGGEVQKAALGKLLLSQPKIILLDEPTKGFDSATKNELGAILKELTNLQVTIFMVTHDLDFAAMVSDRAGLMFDGKIIGTDYVEAFFSKNSYYTTTVSKMTTGIFDNIITYGKLINFCEDNRA